jgi:hypothetical protein
VERGCGLNSGSCELHNKLPDSSEGGKFEEYYILGYNVSEEQIAYIFGVEKSEQDTSVKAA